MVWSARWARSSVYHRSLSLGVIAAAVSLALVGCSSSGTNTGNPRGTSPRGTSGTATSPTSGGTVSLKVTTLNLCDEAPVFWADDKGIFKNNGINVSLVQSQGGAAAIAALQSGAIDLAFTNPMSTMLAIHTGTKLKWVATAYGTPSRESDATSAVFIKTGSSIQSPKNLTGKTVGVNEVGGINQIIVSQWIRDTGGDPTKTKFVALPFSELGPAVASGKVDAAQTIAVPKPDGVRSLGDPYVAVGKGKQLIFAGYVASESGFDSNQTAMAAFQKSLVEADQALNDPANKQEMLKLKSAHCKVPVDALANSPANPYVATVDPRVMDYMGSILKEQGLVSDPPKASDFVASFDLAHG